MLLNSNYWDKTHIASVQYLHTQKLNKLFSCKMRFYLCLITVKRNDPPPNMHKHRIIRLKYR